MLFSAGGEGVAAGAVRAKKVDRCPECGSIELVEDSDLGEVTCNGCGIVLSEHAMSRGREWRAFTKEEGDKRSRAGGSPSSFSISDKGLSTMIDRTDRDAWGRRLSLETCQNMRNLRKWQTRTRTGSSSEKNLNQAMANLDRLADKLHIPPPIKERSAVLYREVLSRGLVRGRSIAGLSSAALYATCRRSGTPRTLKDFEVAAHIKRKEIARCYRLIVQQLDIKMPVEDPARSVAKIASRTGISMASQRLAIDVINRARDKGIQMGKDPMGLAAAALYIACVREHETKTQRTIAEGANVTEVTVRNRYKGLKEFL